MARCKVCGKELKDPVSVRLGIGPVCLAKQRGSKPKLVVSVYNLPPLFDLAKKDEENADQGGNPELPESPEHNS